MVATPLSVAPIYYEHFAAARGGTPTIRSLCGEARVLLLAGIRQSASIERAGTLPVWEALVANLFRGITTPHAMPVAWLDSPR